MRWVGHFAVVTALVATAGVARAQARPPAFTVGPEALTAEAAQDEVDAYVRVRIFGEVGAGLMIGTLGGVIGGAVGSVATLPTCISRCGAGIIVGAIAGTLPSLSLGIVLAGHGAEGNGHYLLSLLGTLPGAAVGGVLAATVDNIDPGLAIGLTLLSVTLMVTGGVVGYEWSSDDLDVPAELRPSTMQVALAPTADGGGQVVLAGRF